MGTVILVYRGKDRTREFPLVFTTSFEKEELIKAAFKVFGRPDDIRVLRSFPADQDRDASESDLGGKDSAKPLPPESLPPNF